MKEHVCHMCLEPFMAENDSKRYCSERCRRKAEKRRRKHKDEQVQERMDAVPPSIDFDGLS